MSKIDELKTLETSFAKKLSAAKIVSTDDLLKRCSNPQSRVTTAAETGIKEADLLKWAHIVDMMRIPGVTGPYAELLNAVGVHNIRELRTLNASTLISKLQEINDKKHFVKVLPTSTTLQGWIEQARTTEPRVI